MVQYPNGLSVSCCSQEIGQFTVRYVLGIETETQIDNSIVCIMMNPSKANLSESDCSVNKVVNFLQQDYKKISICILFPFYKTDSSQLDDLLKGFKEIHTEEKFNQIMDKNLAVIEKIIKNNNKVVFAWGDSPKGFNKEIYSCYTSKVIELANKNSKRMYIFKTNRRAGEITKLGFPRHPSRNSLNGLLEVEVLNMPYLILK